MKNRFIILYSNYGDISYFEYKTDNSLLFLIKLTRLIYQYDKINISVRS